MHRRSIAVSLSLIVLGCGSAAPSNIPVAGDIIGSSCAAEKFVSGLLIASTEFGLGVLDDDGVITPLVLRMHHTTRWSPGWLGGGEWQVLSRGGSVLAVTGRRYRIGGKDFPGSRGFWTCADIFIPI